MDNKETVVTYACLHNSIHVPAVGSFGPTLTKGPSGKTSDLSMVLKNDMLVVTIKGSQVLVPISMVTHLVTAKS